MNLDKICHTMGGNSELIGEPVVSFGTTPDSEALIGGNTIIVVDDKAPEAELPAGDHGAGGGTPDVPVPEVLNDGFE